MKFKANLNYMAYRLNDKTEASSDKSFIFTRYQIFYSDKNRNWFLENYEIIDGDYYEIDFINNVDRLKRYEITINKNRKIKLSLDKKNEFILKWVHRRFYIQQESSNWLKTAVIGLIFSIFTYFLGQFIGFKNGYQDGLKKRNQQPNHLTNNSPKNNIFITEYFVFIHNLKFESRLVLQLTRTVHKTK